MDGTGDLLGWLRDPLPVRKTALRLAADAGVRVWRLASTKPAMSIIIAFSVMFGWRECG
jgi:hypothetical protein